MMRKTKLPEQQEWMVALMHTVAANLPDLGPDHHPHWTIRPLIGPQHHIQGQGWLPTTHGSSPCQPSLMSPHWSRSAGPHLCTNSCTGPLDRYKKWLPYFKKDKFLNDTYITQISVASHLLHYRSLYQNL